MRSLGVRERPLPEALALGPALLDRARRDAAPWMAASVVRGPAVLLGAVQRAAAVVDLAACTAAGAAVLRRATTGTAAWAGGRAVLWTLALPHVAALVPDATARTILNRNVRGFLQGFTRAGALAHYFGREWVAVHHRPCALLGFDVARDGAVLIEVVAGWDEPVALPAALASERERATERWRGHAPLALGELLGARHAPEAVAWGVIEAVAARGRTDLTETAEAAPSEGVTPVTRGDDPVPEGWGPVAAVPVAIGWVEAAAGAGGVWLGGDVLAGRYLLEDAAAGAAVGGDAPLAGALPEDLAGVVALALAGG